MTSPPPSPPPSARAFLELPSTFFPRLCVARLASGTLLDDCFSVCVPLCLVSLPPSLSLARSLFLSASLRVSCLFLSRRVWCWYTHWPSYSVEWQQGGGSKTMSRPFGVALLMAGFDDRGAQVRRQRHLLPFLPFFFFVCLFVFGSVISFVRVPIVIFVDTVVVRPTNYSYTTRFSRCTPIIAS